MRQRQSQRLTTRATIERWEGGDDGDNDDSPFPESSSTTDAGGEYTTVVDGVQCRFNDETTEFVRTDSGTRVSRPATVVFDGEEDVEEDDRITIDGVATAFEAVGIEETLDQRRGRVVKTTVELTEK